MHGNHGRCELAQALKLGSLAKFPNIFQKPVAPRDAWQHSIE